MSNPCIVQYVDGVCPNCGYSRGYKSLQWSICGGHNNGLEYWSYLFCQDKAEEIFIKHYGPVQYCKSPIENSLNSWVSSNVI